ncbi:hypothetical protein BOO69_08810 [Sulfitobacter alexandrii]|uniref:Uncharacterized protein n=1 Tax=Sulfitobacter alexandrii TaxID=1917485 RepID=A0A1J0WGR5_9RHOB|nr:hypothetical protein [Sulfitobacter alexandrii]APE43499.1 hypothetical protein BOO69_08810 [Sulfitobacter alexandrii]
MEHAPVQNPDLDTVLCRLSNHASVLAGLVARAEEAVGESFDRHDGESPGTVMFAELQTLDYLRQSLEDMARLLSGLAPPEGTETGVIAAHLAATLRLADTRALLAPVRAATCRPGFLDGGGAIDLF